MPRSKRGRGGRPPRYEDDVVVRCGRCRRRLGTLGESLPGIVSVTGAAPSGPGPASTSETHYRLMEDERRRWQCGRCGFARVVQWKRVGPAYYQAVTKDRRELVLGVDL
jgi:hypothetical protein